MRFTSLGSGSKGNATLIESGDSLILVDCGYSATQAEKRIRDRGRDPANIDAILVTHEHGDHVKGVSVLSRRFGIPVWSTRGTRLACGDKEFYQHTSLNCHEPLKFGELTATPFPVPHDARDPCQFRFDDKNSSLGLLTDLGSISQHVLSMLAGCQSMLVEFNYDPEMLSNGPYPLSLQRRIAGNWGHLSNQQATHLISQLDTSRTELMIAMHISEKNNRTDLAAEALAIGLNGSATRSLVATQESGFDWITL